jgi:hypothetical protein
MAGFISAGVSENRCKHIMTTSYVCIVVSLAISTLLVILRVITLWSHSRVSFMSQVFIMGHITHTLCRRPSSLCGAHSSYLNSRPCYAVS